MNVVIQSIKSLTSNFSENMPHSFDSHTYTLTLLKIKDSIAQSSQARNKEAINIEAELKLFMPYYLQQVIDHVGEEHVRNLVEECDRLHYFNFELI